MFPKTSVNFKYLILLITLLLSMPDTINCQIKIKAVGDIMLGSVTPKKVLPPGNGKVFVKSLDGLLKNADIIFGNLEGAFITDSLEPKKCSERSRRAKTCYEFGMPENLAPVLKETGFNVLNQDNNHSEDYGYEGYEFTQELLTDLGIKFMPKGGLAEFETDNKKIAIVAFGYSDNSNNISDLQNSREVVTSLDKEYDLIIVSFHGGAEGKNAAHVADSTEIFLDENRGNVYAFAHAVIDAGADMVIGHGPHVLRAMEIYKNKLIAYSLGNFLTYGNINISGITGVSVILYAEIDTENGNFNRGKLIPVRQFGSGVPVYDDNGEGISLIRGLTKEDLPDAKIFITTEGKIYNTTIDFIHIRGVDAVSISKSMLVPLSSEK